MQRKLSCFAEGAHTASRLLLVAVLGGLLAACASSHAPVLVSLPVPILPKHYLLNVTTLQLSGNVNVTVLPDEQGFDYATRNPDVAVSVHGDTLAITNTVHTNTHHSLPADLTVYTHTVRSITMMGASSLHMRGHFHLQNIQQASDGVLDVRWLDTHTLVLLQTGNGFTRLAGTAAVFSAKLRDQSRLDASYLRARQAFVQTDDGAKASVLAIDRLSAFAKGRSNIYYLKTPTQLTRNSREAGNVLKAGERR